MIKNIVLLLLTPLISLHAFAQVVMPITEVENTADLSHGKFVAVMSGFYGRTYPAGSIQVSDDYVKRQKGKYFGATQAIGYRLWQNGIVHGGFTLWDGKVAIARHMLMHDLKTEYSIDTCSLHIGIMYGYKWFFADAILYTELPLEKDTERVELDGVYVQTNTLNAQYEYGGFLGIGVRAPVYNWLDVFIGFYGGGSFVPSIETTKHDKLYLLNGALRIGIIVYFPDQE